MAILNVEQLHRTLDAARQARGMSWRQVAFSAGVSPSTLNRLGTGHQPSVEGLVALCRWLGVPMESFVRGRRSALPPSQTVETEVAAILARHVISPTGRDAVLTTLRAVRSIQ